MKYLKRYSKSRELDSELRDLSKIFESGITIHTQFENTMNMYLNELGTTVEELNDIFGELIDLGYNSYLQLFYLDKRGSRYSSLPSHWTRRESVLRDLIGEKNEDNPFVPYLSISFEKDINEDETIYNSTPTTRFVYSNEVDSIVSFSDSVSRLKSTYKDKKIYWKFKPSQMEVCIYFDPITESDEVK